MRDFEVEQVSVNFKWEYERLLQSLPVLGTDAFGTLCKRLAPFKLNASGIVVEAPTNSLGDARMTIILLDGRLGIRFTISFFEIVSDDFLDSDKQNIIDIAEIIFDALKKIDEDAEVGNASIKLTYHLKLDSGENSKLLSEHLNLSNDIAELSPEVAIYKINPAENRNLQNAGVVLANSVIYSNSIFFDVTLNYLELGDIREFAGSLTNDVVGVFNLFELNGEILQNQRGDK